MLRRSAAPPFYHSIVLSFHHSPVPLFHRSTSPVPSFHRFFPTILSHKVASGSPHVVKFNMATRVAGSQLFCPFRALGFVANHVPLTTQTQGTETLVTTAVGSAFHVYNVGQFRVISCAVDSVNSM